MDYIWTVKGKDYKLKLKTSSLVMLERTIGRNPLELFGRDGGGLPTTAELASVIHAAIQADRSCTIEVVYDMIDDWLDDGHKYEELFNIVTEIYYGSGVISRPEEETKTKNAKKARA